MIEITASEYCYFWYRFQGSYQSWATQGGNAPAKQRGGRREAAQAENAAATKKGDKGQAAA